MKNSYEIFSELKDRVSPQTVQAVCNSLSPERAHKLNCVSLAQMMLERAFVGVDQEWANLSDSDQQRIFSDLYKHTERVITYSFSLAQSA